MNLISLMAKFVLFFLISGLALQTFAQRERPRPLSEREPIANICRAIFVHTDDKPLYGSCRDARWYANFSTGVTAAKYTFISLSITIGLIGIIPYAQNRDATVWWVAAGLFAAGLLTIIPEVIVEGTARRKKRNVLERYNKMISTLKSKSTAEIPMLYKPQPFTLAWKFRY